MAVAQAGIVHLGYLARKHAGEEDSKARQAGREAELGRILFSALNRLKGTALKASQLLSMETGLLPEGVRLQLARSFHQATPLNRALVHRVFRQEFSRDADQLFQYFDPQAFAAASLGQVHHAQLHGGEPVVVKLQYPGIASSIGVDMRMIRSLLQGVRLSTDLLPDSDIVERLMADIEYKLAEEVDYTHEAEQLRWFGEHALLPGIVVPQPIASHSTRHVLTMQAVDGLHLDAWLVTNPSQQARDRAGQLLFDWFLHSTFVWRRLHADPHPGNFLFLPDGQIGVVDFGCTKRLSPDFTAALAKAWCALLQHQPDGDCEALRQHYVDLAMISPSLSLAEFERELMPALASLQAWQIAPFRTARFDFATRSPYPAFEATPQRAIARYMTGFRDEIPYFERTYLGISHMLKSLRARVSTDNRWVGAGT